MVGESFDAWGGDAREHGFEGWRCLICGEIVDDVIVNNREGGGSMILHGAKQRRWPTYQRAL